MLHQDVVESNARFAAAIAALHALDPRPALALLSGDLVDEGTPAEYANLRKLLGGLDIPSLVILGNRDDRDAFRRAFRDHDYPPQSGPTNYAVGTRVCRHSFECKDNSDHVTGGSEACFGFVESGGDTAKLFDLLEEVLDEMTPFVNLYVIGEGLGATGVWRDDGEGAALIELEAQPVGIEGLVADQRAQRDAVEQRLDADRVVALAGQKDEAGEIVERVDRRYDNALGSRRRPERSAPPDPFA